MNSSYHELKGQSCSNCRYARSYDKDLDQCSCLRHAPRPLPSMAFDQPEDRDTFWPQVGCDQWCGEWAHAEGLL